MLSNVVPHLAFPRSLLSLFISSKGTETDIAYLKSIKHSLIDPYGYLNASWNFNNFTEGFICNFKGVECWYPDENRVFIIRLSKMGLQGELPLGLWNCTSLVGLDLSYNKLSGPIPHNISHIISYVTSLDLSYNSFSGEIPVSIANCTFLNLLRLENNQLNSQIPPEKLGYLNRIKIFSVANNLLSGPVPVFDGSFSDQAYANNPGLCEKPLEPCESRTHRNRFWSGFVTGYVVFAVSVTVICVSYCVPWVNNRNKMITITMMAVLMRKYRRRTNKLTSSPATELIYQGDTEISMLEKRVTRMSYVDLRDATDNFSKSNIIGMRKMGILYKATLPNCFVLAVKKLHDSQFLEEQFISELKTLGSLRHVNLLPLFGFCIQSVHRLLIYKYMPNGSLYDWVHPMEGQGKVMEWAIREKVAFGLARGLAWLHQNCHTIRIIHLDLGSKCILLGQNFEPKSLNFGEAMLISSTNACYLDSEFWETAFVKEDVFGFGVVLLELITGVDFIRMTDSRNNVLSESINNLINSSNFNDAVDKSLVGQGFDAGIFHISVASSCM